jgi:hypothetical protein
MKLSHPACILASLLVTAAATGVSCSFPKIEFFGPTSGTGGGGGAISSATGGATESSTASTGGEGNSGASSSSDSSSSGGANCMTDEDQDEAISSQCQQGTDCADQDDKAHPEPPPVTAQSAPIQGATAPNTLPYDFNCDGQETGETLVLNCQLFCNSSEIGYQSAVKCGDAALVGHCEAVSCKWTAESPPQNRVQKCK